MHLVSVATAAAQTCWLQAAPNGAHVPQLGLQQYWPELQAFAPQVMPTAPPVVTSIAPPEPAAKALPPISKVAAPALFVAMASAPEAPALTIAVAPALPAVFDAVVLPAAVPPLLVAVALPAVPLSYVVVLPLPAPTELAPEDPGVPEFPPESVCLSEPAHAEATAQLTEVRSRNPRIGPTWLIEEST